MITLQVTLPPVRRGIQDSLAELMQAEMSQDEAQMMACSNVTNMYLPLQLSWSNLNICFKVEGWTQKLFSDLLQIPD